MERKHLTLKSGHVTKCIFWSSLLLLILAINVTFTSCDDNDNDPRYVSYATVDSISTKEYLIILDNGKIARPKNTMSFDDSTRLIMEFSILETGDTTSNIDYNILINQYQKINTERILAYDAELLATLGNDPVDIPAGECWIANGFLTIEFLCLGESSTQHKVYMMQLPSEEGLLKLEFRHDATGDGEYQVRKSAVSFPISHLLEGLTKPAKIQVSYQDGHNSSRTIELDYK